MKCAKMLAVLLGLGMLGATSVRAEMEKGPDHEWNVEKMQKKLGLSADQAAKLKALRDTQKEALKPLMDKQRGLMEKLKGQIDGKASDADIKATMDDLKSNREALRTQMEQFQNQRADILTPTQQANMMLAMHERMHKRGQEKMHDHDKTNK